MHRGMLRVQVGLDSGFYAYPLVDPAIVGDVNGDGVINGPDATDLLLKTVYPPSWTGMPGFLSLGYPYGTVLIPAGPDPTVEIGEAGTVAEGGETVSTAIRITDSAAGADGRFHHHLRRQPTGAPDADVTLSPYLAGQGWSMAEHVEQATGTVHVALLGNVLPAGTPELLDLTFHVAAATPCPGLSLDIAVALNGRLSDDDAGRWQHHRRCREYGDLAGFSGIGGFCGGQLDSSSSGFRIGGSRRVRSRLVAGRGVPGSGACSCRGNSGPEQRQSAGVHASSGRRRRAVGEAYRLPGRGSGDPGLDSVNLAAAQDDMNDVLASRLDHVPSASRSPLG